jgi:hypothetical protein
MFFRLALVLTLVGTAAMAQDKAERFVPPARDDARGYWELER